MKKIFILAVTATLVACSSKTKGSDSVSDSDADDQELVVEESDISPEVKNFKSPDLALNMLHSKVEYAVTETYSAKEKKHDEFEKGKLQYVDSIFFDESGRMTRKSTTYKDSDYWVHSVVEVYNYDSNGKLKKASMVQDTKQGKIKFNVKVTRDANGYISEIGYQHSSGDDVENFADHYKWKDGQLKSLMNVGWEWTTETKYKYDENGFLHKASSESGEEGMVSTSSEKYDYISFDECNNWTIRTVKSESTGETWEEAPTPAKTTVSYTFQQRTLVYRK